MIDVSKDLNLSELEKNFLLWLGVWKCPQGDDDPPDAPLNVPLTHTFPARKVWTTGEKDLCSEILETGTGLLSDQYREDHGLYRTDEPRPRMPEARLVQLNRFVFAYLGVHDAFYSRRHDGGFTQAFGLFLRKSIEVFPYCNATRRDLASKESSFKSDPRADFLTAEHARRLCGCQVAKDARHKGDFWQYWGASEFWNPKYAEEHWEWKYEFHFFEKVAVNDLEAVLWPEVAASAVGGGTRLSSLHDRAEAFRGRFPQCHIVFYDWDDRLPTKSFLDASTAVTKFRLAHGKYPPLAADALARFGSSS